MTKIVAMKVLFVAVSLAMVCSVDAQEPTSQVIAVVKQLKQQQAELAHNQTSLDAKIADLTETIRAARIYTSRAGGKHKVPAPK
jgi:orotidine-5'-phosphate decarboxylase